MKKIAITIFLMVLFSSFGLFAQTDWVKYTENPVLDVGPPGSWDDVEIWPTRVLLLDSVYHMWYSGYSGTTIRIGHATSPDGISWTKDTLNPILTGDWAYVISTPLEYKMWYYSGNNIRYATSLNGLEWTTHPEPVLSPGPLNWDGVSVNGPSVMETLDGYEMWYHGFRGYELAQIGYATAVNETTWTKADDINPVLTDGDTGEWDSREVFGPRVLYNADSERYEMWYAGTISNYLNTQVGYAWSQDGLVWEKDSLNPVLNVDEGPELAVIHGDIILDPEAPPDERYKMWYAGYTGSRWWIGYATAPSDSLSVNDVGNSLPVKFALHQNHPNPFNPATTLSFDLPKRSEVKLTIYDLLGKEVKKLVHGIEEPGPKSIIWDGTNNRGEQVSAGVYLYRIQVGDQTQSRKMILLK